jgi:hypothetical protein
LEDTTGFASSLFARESGHFFLRCGSFREFYADVAEIPWQQNCFEHKMI